MNVSHGDDWQYGRVYDVTTVRKPSMARKPRMRAVALSDTLCTRADGTTYIIPRKQPTTTTRKRKPTVVRETSRDMLLMATMGTIHDANTM